MGAKKYFYYEQQSPLNAWRRAPFFYIFFILAIKLYTCTARDGQIGGIEWIEGIEASDSRGSNLFTTCRALH